uniref:Uncharacterized protein n=1 Tax=Alexandrium catenella TaxID=2925 RepID=A0A7S1WVQ1_ALECA|mmetsp:Transcript_95518/g.253768  ORF Transcript_95518/g.253768 Transcript_95518/m.253768 type:complete len:170 (+) Transcript_95518:77-586(+)
MWGIPAPCVYPAADGWTPPAVPTNDEALHYQQQVDSWPKKTLVKRFTLLKERKMQSISQPDSMEQHGFSISCIPLAPWSRFSGQGDEKGWMAWIYYQPADEQKTLKFFEGQGVDLSKKERTAVDPDSPDEEEQIMMLCKQQSHHASMWEHQILVDGEAPAQQPDAKYWE